MMNLRDEAFKIEIVLNICLLGLPCSTTTSKSTYLKMDPEILNVEPGMDN